MLASHGDPPDIGPKWIGASVVEMRLVRPAQKRRASISGFYVLEFPHHAGQAREYFFARNLIAHGVCLLGRTHHMRHAIVAPFRCAPTGPPHSGKRPLAPETVTIIPHNRSFRQNLGEDARDGRMGRASFEARRNSSAWPRRTPRPSSRQFPPVTIRPATKFHPRRSKKNFCSGVINSDIVPPLCQWLAYPSQSLGDCNQKCGNAKRESRCPAHADLQILIRF